MTVSYAPYTDPVIQALTTEATADPDVIGLVLTGSRSVGDVVPESDYDVVFVITDAAMTRYEETGITPERGTTVTSQVDLSDVWHESSRSLTLEAVIPWMLPAWADAMVLYDPTGEVSPLIDSLRQMPADQAKEAVASAYDAYLNGLYRSLKSWRRDNELGARLEAAESASYLIETLFALERQWRPYSSRLKFHLHKLDIQGWKSGEVQAISLNLISTGDPYQQQVVAHRVIALLNERGYHHVYEAWDGAIDRVLGCDTTQQEPSRPMREII